MSRDTKILCVCQMGNVRSVGTKYRLNRRNYYDVIATGVSTTNTATLSMLCEWAEIILVAEPAMADELPCYQDKINTDFTIGEDTYGNPLRQSLQELVKEQLDKIGLR